MIERRQFGRRKSFFHGMIQPEGRPAIRCRVINISESGALIELMQPVQLPYSFKLYIDAIDRAIACELKHANRTKIGVMFGTLQPDLVSLGVHIDAPKFKLSEPVEPSEPVATAVTDGTQPSIVHAG